MKRNINNAEVDKKLILSKISQISIFSVYTGLDANIIQKCIDDGSLISSPFRIDNHPSFGFRYAPGGKLKAKDFAGYFWGDCFDVVAYVLSNIKNREFKVNNKADFRYILNHIAYVFSDIIYNKEKDDNIIIDINNGLNNIRNKKNVIEFVTRPWNNLDKKYWNQFGINLNYLNTHFVYAIDQYYINRNVNPMPKYYYDEKDLCYGYILGQDKNGIYNVKLYFPNRKKGDVRFITNSNHIEGVLNFQRNDYDYIVITKSTKDRMALECYINQSIPLRGVNIGIINIPHETYNLKQKEYDYIKERLANNGIIISLMDNDRTGYKEAVWLKNNYNIPPIIISKDLDCKDFAELVNKYSIDTINNFVNQTINYIKTNYTDEEIEYTWNTKESNIIPF